MERIIEKAYAKINLTLRVFPKREDGYHGIDSVMQTVSLFDTVELEQTASGIGLEIEGDASLPTGRENLAFLAAEMFLSKAGIREGVSVRLRKRIPIAAGLAGGSADAAAVLRGLDRLYPGRLTRDDLLGLAGAVGSDVSFCLVGGKARCTGRGEILCPMNDDSESYYVIACTKEKVSTKQAYELVDAVISKRREGSENETGSFNDFEKAILPLCPEANKLKKRLYELGAMEAMMSGSGPAVFGVFDTETHASQAALTLKAEVAFAQAVKNVSNLL